MDNNENNDEILKLISASLNTNQAINEEITRLLHITTIPSHEYKTIEKLLRDNVALLNLLREIIPS